MYFTFIDKLIHPELRDTSHPKNRKARLVVSAMILFLVSYIPYLLYFTIRYPDDINKLIVNISGIPIFLLTFIIIRYLRNIDVLLGLLNLVCYVLIFTSIYHTGGIYSADIAWVILTMLSAFVIINNFWGIISMCSALIGTLLLFFLEQNKIQENYFKEYVLQHDSTHYVFTWSFVILLLSMLLFSINKVIESVNNKIKELHQANINILELKLNQKTKEITEMRSNIAKDFHDEMGNKLASISILSQSIAFHLKNNQLDILTLLETIEKRSKELYDGTKDFIWSIDVRNDNIYELFQYTRDFGERFFLPLGMSFFAQSNINIDTVKRFNTNVTRQYLFIMKEVFTNAAKHSKATEINVVFKLDEKKLNITISDNGVGLIMPDKKTGGISNIKQRIKDSNAEVIISADTTGTSYFFSIPLEVS